MSKIQLKNVGSMDEFASGAPVMQSSYTDDSGLFDDSGFWNESGWWDDSGDIYDVKGGYEYYYVNVPNDRPNYYNEPAFSVRFIIMWTSGNITAPPAIRVHAACDDGTLFNPFSSGIMGNPIEYWDDEHYEHKKSYMDGVILDGYDTLLTIRGGYNITYKFYRYGKSESNSYTLKNQNAPFEFVIPASYIRKEEEDE